MAKPSRNPRDARRPTPASGGRARTGARSTTARPGQARPAGRRTARRGASAGAGARIGWSRRAGIVLGLLVLGTSIVLAGGSLSGAGAPGPSREPGASGPADTSAPTGILPPAPALAAPAEALTTASATDVAGSIPVGIPRDGAYSLRIYVNDELVRDRRLPADETFTVRNVPLEQGPNVIRAAITGPVGESLHSPAVQITRDDLPPALRVLEPGVTAAVHLESVLIRGRTEAGATVTATNSTLATDVDAAVGADGRFEATLGLAMGANRITLLARDAAGNRSRVSLAVVRQESTAHVDLRLSRDSISFDGLPTSISLTAYISDDTGSPVDGADVTFSISPPGQPTSTFRGTSSGGSAVWRGVRLPREGALPGQGLATVLVTLPDGRTLQGSATFTVR